MQIESQPLTTLAKKEASYLAKLTAYGTLNSALSTFQSSFVGLNSTAAFQNLTANVGDATILNASTTSVATAGNYNINVTQLAKSQTISSAGQASTTDTIGSGATTTISFQFGTISGGTSSNGVYTGASFTQDANQAIGTVTIDSSNNSLQGIRDAINAAGKGVTASIVGDGTATPYHLVLSSNKTGVTSSLKIDVSGDATLQGLLSYDPAGTQNFTETTTAQNANLSINGINITSASNTVNDAVQGAAITLTKTGSTTLALTNNVAGVQNSINTFVKGFNDLQATFKTLTGFDATTKKGAVLTGDAAARGAQTQVRSALSSAVNGLGGNITTLSSIGISFQKDGTLSVDSTKLQAALNNNFKEISGLFATIGKATDSLVSYSTSTANTTQGSYALNVTALASQGSLTGDLDLTAGNTTIDPGTSINVTIDGVSSSISLAAGSYSSTQLTTLLQTSINGATAFTNAGIKVAATTTGSGFLKLTSNSYGSTSNVALSNGTGTAISSFTGTVFSGTPGTNVTGSFNGVSAVGTGQFLTGTAGSAADGLKVLISGGATGDRGTVHFSKGYASQLNTLFSSIVGSTGSISSSTDGVNRSIKDIGKQRDILNNRLIDTEARYRAQFTALDSIVSGLNNTSTFLTQQLSALTGSNK
jgi:flagellar hook-associated protein 2